MTTIDVNDGTVSCMITDFASPVLATATTTSVNDAPSAAKVDRAPLVQARDMLSNLAGATSTATYGHGMTYEGVRSLIAADVPVAIDLMSGFLLDQRDAGERRLKSVSNAIGDAEQGLRMVKQRGHNMPDTPAEFDRLGDRLGSAAAHLMRVTG